MTSYIDKCSGKICFDKKVFYNPYSMEIVGEYYTARIGMIVLLIPVVDNSLALVETAAAMLRALRAYRLYMKG